MTRDALPQPFLGRVGRRLVLTFAAVAVLAVALVAAAGLVGSARGLASQVTAEHEATASRLAASAAAAYSRAGSWSAADLGELRSAVVGTGTRATLLDTSGGVIAQYGMGGMGQMGQHGMGQGPGAGTGQHDSDEPSDTGDTSDTGVAGADVSTAVVVDGRTVGQLVLTFPQTVVVGRPVAWSWVLWAAALALVLAVASGVAAARALTRPVLALTAATRSFAAGDRSARPVLRGPGELGELADAFDEAATATEAAEAARRQLAADVTHELRTPLAALVAGLEELRDGLAPADPETLARLHDQSLRLGRVVGDLAELSSAEAAGRTMALDRIEPVDLAALAGEECAAREAQLRAAELVLETRLGRVPAVPGDPHRLHQVVGNLLENCIRHCRPGDRVEVRVDLVHSAPPAVRLVVADTGPGIAPDDLPHVLTRFWRSAQARNRSVGSGLGLAITAELVRAHHGTIEVTSPGRTDGTGPTGTTVTILLPTTPRGG